MSSPTDRRGRPRVASAGTATVQRGSGEQAEFAIRDLSSKGARLVGNARLVEGERVRVALALEGVTVTVAAVVTRTDPQQAQAAIEFRQAAGEALHWIEQAIGRMIERVRAASRDDVLVLHPSAEIRAALERDLSRLERTATLCATPLETMWAMQDDGASHQAVIASDALGPATGDLLRHFAEHHPHIRRVLLFGEQLASVDHELSSKVDSVLRTPWRIRALARALGIDATDSSLVLLPAADFTDPKK